MSTEELLAAVAREMAEAIERNEWCLIRWGRPYAACTHAERADAHRLRCALPGAGYEP